MKETEFDKIFNNYVNPKRFGVRSSRTYTENVSEFQKLAFLRHNCKFLYKYLGNIYGDEYGDKIVKDLAEGTLEITNPEKFTYSNFTYIEDCMCLNKFLETVTAKNFITVITELEHIILNEVRYGRNILFPDALIILSTFYTKFIKGKYGNNMSFHKKKELYMYAQTALKNFLKVLSTKFGELDTPITLGVLDKSTFKRLITDGNYTFDYVDFRALSRLSPNYKNYCAFMKVFLKCYASIPRKYKLPKLVYYILPTESINHKVVMGMVNYLNTHIVRIGCAVERIYFTEDTDLDSPECIAVLEECIKRSKSNKTLSDVKEFISDIISTGLDPLGDRVEYTELPIYKFMKKVRVKSEKPYVLSNMYSNEKVFSPKRSEVVINYDKIYDDTLTVDEQFELLSKYYIDAQAINQARLSIFSGVNYTDCRCHVKVRGIKKELVPVAFVKLQEQTLFLRSTYNVNFTFELEKDQNLD